MMKRKSTIKPGKNYFEHIFKRAKRNDYSKEIGPTSIAQVRNYARYDIEKYLGILEDKILGDGNKFHGLVSSNKKEEIEEQIDNLKTLLKNSIDEEWNEYRNKIRDLKDS